MTELVRFEGLSFAYPGGPGPVIERADFKLARGERLLLTGASGAGKSTLLLLMAGLIPDPIPGRVSGRVELGYRRRALVLQNPEAQVVTPTVEEELAFPLENLGIARPAMRERVESLLGLFRLEAFRGRNALDLSGGECQRVSLASALAAEPDVLFLDEPTSYLDPAAAAAFFEALRGLPAGTSVVMVEHHLRLASEFCTRFLELGPAGRLRELSGREAVGAPPLARPAGVKARPAAVSRPALEVRGLAHRYPGAVRAVLESVSFSLRAGEIMAVQGPSGCGKTTLLGKLARGLPLESGCVFYKGKDAAQLAAAELYGQLMLVPQNPEHLFLFDRVEQELDSAGGGRARELADYFGLAGLLAAHPFRLSEGEKRRLSLAVAFASGRPFLLLDEPTYGLDRPNAAKVAAALERLRRAGSAILMVTHDREFAELAADRIVSLEAGRMQEAESNEVVPSQA